jgi:hypothetical protein
VIVLTGEQVPAAERALAVLATLPVRAPTAVRIVRLARAVAEAAAEIRAHRDRLVETHAARDEEGRLVPATDPEMRERGLVRIDPDGARALETELAHVLAASIEIHEPPLRPEDLTREGGAPVDIAAAVLLGLGPLFQDSAPAHDGGSGFRKQLPEMYTSR